MVYVSDFTTGFIGVIVAITAGLLSIYKFQENWIKYRTTSEILKHQKHLYLASVTPYDGSDKYKVLVKNIESIISKENSEWQSHMVKEKK